MNQVCTAGLKQTAQLSVAKPMLSVALGIGEMFSHIETMDIGEKSVPLSAVDFLLYTHP